MKKQLLLLLTLVAFIARSQTNLVIFSEEGEPFYAFINGVKQNVQPETNVKVTNVTPNISLRVEFADKSIPAIKQTMSLEQGFEHTARLKRDKNKQMKLRYFGQVPLNETAANVPSVEYHTATTGGEEPASVNDNPVTTSTVTTSQTTESMNVNMSVPGVMITMNSAPAVRATTSTTVTQTTTSSNSTNSKTAVAPNNTYTAAGCRQPMSQSGFAKLKQSVESKPFSDTRMSTARVATKNNCLSVSQVKEICKLFSMDDDKLAYAKFAYDYCVDKGNYYQVSEVFSFSTTADELNKFLDK